MSLLRRVGGGIDSSVSIADVPWSRSLALPKSEACLAMISVFRAVETLEIYAASTYSERWLVYPA